MNTMTISSGPRLSTTEYAGEFAGRALVIPKPVPAPVWLPAPKAIRVAPRVIQKSHKSILQNFRRTRVQEFRWERLMMLCLAGAAVAGITYGFSCLIDLVQHWAVFNAGVGQLIQ